MGRTNSGPRSDGDTRRTEDESLRLGLANVESGERFEYLTRLLAGTSSRAQACKILLTSALGLALPLWSRGPAEAASAYTVCPYEFTAVVRQGPDTRLTLAGRLGLVQMGPHEVFGILQRRGADGKHPVRVAGSVRGTEITLAFHLPTGQTLTGRGRWDGGVRRCGRRPLRGAFTGPRRLDRGDWAANPDGIVSTTLYDCGTCISSCRAACPPCPYPPIPGCPEFDNTSPAGICWHRCAWVCQPPYCVRV